MLLIFNASCTDCYIRKQVGQISVVLRIKHFVGTGKTCLLDSILMEITHLDNALKHIGLFLGIRLMKHSFIACSRGSRLSGINSGDNKNFILHLLLNLGKAVNIIKNRIRTVCRTRSDNKRKLIAFTGEYFFYFFISDFFFCDCFGRKRVLLLNLLWNRKFSVEVCINHIIHGFTSLCLLMGLVYH